MALSPTRAAPSSSRTNAQGAGLRVLFITRKYPPMVGGLETLSYHLTTGFPEPKRVVALGRLQRHLLWFLPYATARVLFTGWRYDLIHVGDPMLAVVGAVARVVWKRKVVVGVHGLDLVYGHRLYQWYLRTFLSADTYVAISAATRRIAEQRGLGPLEVITIGVSNEFFSIRRNPNAHATVSAERKGRPVLITSGRLIARKGVAWFIAHVLPRLDALYVVVGNGRDREKIRNIAREAGVADRVLMFTEADQAELFSLLSAADIFVMPNIPIPNDVEGFGIVAIEAAASGLPVVAARLEGIPDAVVDGVTGVLVEPKDAQAFADAIVELAKDEARRVEFGERARRYVESHNDWGAVIDRYRALFFRLVGAELKEPLRSKEASPARQSPS
jgi:glycosyltransferase involved in cell wall biosynthesis